MAERQRERTIARARLARLVLETPAVGQQIEAALHAFNGEPGRPESFNELHELLESQPDRLSCWRTASREINYRRFSMSAPHAGMRVERPEVFGATHKLLETAPPAETDDRRPHRSIIRTGCCAPARLLPRCSGACRAPGTSDSLGRTATTPPAVVAEKIVSGQEALPRRWAVHGTTGYKLLPTISTASS